MLSLCPSFFRPLAVTGVLLSALMAHAGDGRISVSLNGTWQIEESASADDMPATFKHSVVVPGLVNLAMPEFSDVGLFASRDHLAPPRDGVYCGIRLHSPGDPWPGVGIPLQKRSYFWYQTSFRPTQKREVALLRIAKAQFGTAVWLNGKKVGENLSCWTAGVFDLTQAIRWDSDNRLVVRIGAHPAVIPANLLGAGSDMSKPKWTPGIYDNVALLLCDNPVIESIQVAPRLKSSEAVVQTVVKNYGAARDFQISHRIKTWKEGVEVVQSSPQSARIEPGEERTFTQTIPIPNARWWSPDDPFLYIVESCTGGDSVATRFGMREFHFDGATRLGYLNGKPLYLRGGNIEYVQWVETANRGTLAWDRAWVRRLLAEIPKRLYWNAFRLCLSPVPEMWLDIADEEGILIQYEPTVWQHHDSWNREEMIKEYSRWMRDNWNRPCIFMWDAGNENNSTGENSLEEIVKAIRSLDLSGRAWDNGGGPINRAPANPNDPVEAHPYVFADGRFIDLRRLSGKLSDINDLVAIPWKLKNPMIVNEYCWLWLPRDGRAPLGPPEEWCRLKELYETVIPNSTNEERKEFRWYMTGALTEMWRAQRIAAGVLYYMYLAEWDAFEDDATLRLQAGFERYMTEAFKPLGVYIDFWGDGAPGSSPPTAWPPIRGGANHPIVIVMINDDSEPVKGRLTLSIESPEAAQPTSCETRFELDGLGRATYKLNLPIPGKPGKYSLKAAAYPDGDRHKSPTISWRKVSVALIAPPNSIENPGAQ